MSSKSRSQDQPICFSYGTYMCTTVTKASAKWCEIPSYIKAYKEMHTDNTNKKFTEHCLRWRLNLNQFIKIK